MPSSAPRTVSLLTPYGRGAVAVVQIQGEGAAAAVDQFFHARSKRPLASLPIGRIAFGSWQAPGESAGEELVAVRRSEQVVEVQCHGGRAAVDAVRKCLVAAGFESTNWRTPAIAEADDCLAAAAMTKLPFAVTLRTAAILLDQVHGALHRELEAIAALLDSDRATDAQARLDALLALAPIGRHLTDYWQVALVGKPNAGKSSLMNALVGFQRAIVHDAPGTTRDALMQQTAIDGWPIELIDTAGVRETTSPLEAAAIEVSRKEAIRAGLILHVCDASIEPQVEAPLEMETAKTLTVWNKADLVPPDWQPKASDSPAVVVSAATGYGIPELLAAIVERLVPETPPAGAAIPLTGRQIGILTAAAESLRSGNRSEAKRLLVSLPVCEPDECL